MPYIPHNLFFCIYPIVLVHCNNSFIYTPQGRRQGGGLRGLQPPPNKRKWEKRRERGEGERRKRKEESKEKGSWTRHSKNMWSKPSGSPQTSVRNNVGMSSLASACLSQNPAYVPAPRPLLGTNSFKPHIPHNHLLHIYPTVALVTATCTEITSLF